MFPDFVPYTAIGKVVFMGSMIVLSAIVLTVGLFTVYFIWNRFWYSVSEYMWNGHRGSENDNPPVWKTRISGVSLALGRLQLFKIPAVYNEAEEIAEEDE